MPNQTQIVYRPVIQRQIIPQMILTDTNSFIQSNFIQSSSLINTNVVLTSQLIREEVQFDPYERVQHINSHSQPIQLVPVQCISGKVQELRMKMVPSRAQIAHREIQPDPEEDCNVPEASPNLNSKLQKIKKTSVVLSNSKVFKRNFSSKEAAFLCSNISEPNKSDPSSILP